MTARSVPPGKVLPFPKRRTNALSEVPGFDEAEAIIERLGPIGAMRVAQALGTTVEELFGDQVAGRSSTRGRRRLIPLDELGGTPAAETGT